MEQLAWEFVENCNFLIKVKFWDFNNKKLIILWKNFFDKKKLKNILKNLNFIPNCLNYNCSSFYLKQNFQQNNKNFWLQILNKSEFSNSQNNFHSHPQQSLTLHPQKSKFIN